MVLAARIVPGIVHGVTSTSSGHGGQVEELFDGIGEEVGDDGVRVAVASSGGDEGVAWIAWSSIDESERPYALVGAPVQVSIFKQPSESEERRWHVRFARPSEYHPSPRTREVVASYLLERMESVLSDDER